MIYDDYSPLIWLWPNDIRPKQTIDAFVADYLAHLEPVHQGMQLIVRKRENICDSRTERLSPVGQYCYNWNAKRLFRLSDRAPVDLSPEEKNLIETYTNASPFLQYTAGLRERPEFQALNKRLRLELP